MKGWLILLSIAAWLAAFAHAMAFGWSSVTLWIVCAGLFVIFSVPFALVAYGTIKDWFDWKNAKIVRTFRTPSSNRLKFDKRTGEASNVDEYHEIAEVQVGDKTYFTRVG